MEEVFHCIRVSDCGSGFPSYLLLFCFFRQFTVYMIHCSKCKRDGCLDMKEKYTAQVFPTPVRSDIKISSVRYSGDRFPIRTCVILKAGLGGCPHFLVLSY